MSDFEVNKALTELLAWSEPNCKNVTFENGCFWVNSVGFSAFKIENYCNSPNDIMPLVFKNGISLISLSDGYMTTKSTTFYTDEAFNSIEFCDPSDMEFADTNPLRAAACCLILVLQEKK